MNCNADGSDLDHDNGDVLLCEDSQEYYHVANKEDCGFWQFEGLSRLAGCCELAV